jgi:heptosyltransferase II
MQILVRAPNWLGDIVMSAGFFLKLAETFPLARTDVVVAEAFADVVRLFPGVDAVHPFSKKQFAGPLGLFRYAREKLGADAYDIFFCLPDSFSSALMGWLSGSRKRIGYRNDFRSPLLSHAYPKPDGLHRAEEYAFLLRDYAADPLQRLTVRIEWPKAGKPLAVGGADHRFQILLHPNSEAPSRRLPLKKAVDLVNALIDRYDCRILFSGTDHDRLHVHNLRQRLRQPQNTTDLTGRTSILELAQIMDTVDLVISTDSGPAHLANSMGARLIVLWGPADVRKTAPYERNGLSIVQAPPLACQPCGKNKCRNGSLNCLMQLDMQTILGQVDRMLGMERKEP